MGIPDDLFRSLYWRFIVGSLAIGSTFRPRAPAMDVQAQGVGKDVGIEPVVLANRGLVPLPGPGRDSRADRVDVVAVLVQQLDQDRRSRRYLANQLGRSLGQSACQTRTIPPCNENRTG